MFFWCWGEMWPGHDFIMRFTTFTCFTWRFMGNRIGLISLISTDECLAQLSQWTFLSHVNSERLCYALNLFLRCLDNCLFIGGLTWHNMIWPELWYICLLPSNCFSHLGYIQLRKRKGSFVSSVKQLMFILTSFYRHRNVAKGTILQHDVYVT